MIALSQPKIQPSMRCRNCQHFEIADDPSFYIDSFHMYCSACKYKNSFGDSESTCIDDYSQYRDRACECYCLKENHVR